MNSMDEIRRAASLLAPSERGALAAWLLESSGEVPGVAEPAAAYGAEQEPLRLSVDEYLAFEERATIKHEYVAGDVFAMSGVSLRHNAISLNLVIALAGRLRGGPCKAFVSDVKVRFRIGRDEFFYYPDLVVACGSLQMEERFIQEPKLIIEVLSPSTERINRREKAFHYRQIPSLEEYVLVAQALPEVVLSRRGEDWAPRVIRSAGAAVALQSVGLELSLEEIYAGAT
jgi:Uma2 family endonuclease